MANLHYGRFGDAFKHLLLTEILKAEEPSAYWESHAGSATYPMLTEEEGRLGAHHLLHASRECKILGNSCFVDRLRDHQSRSPPTYPGSGALAMELLPADSDLLFADLDPGSIDNLKAYARERGVGERACFLRKDGIELLRQELSGLSESGGSQLLVFIDPYIAFRNEAGPSRMTPLQLFERFSREGVRSVIWFGYNSASRQAHCHRHILRNLSPGSFRGFEVFLQKIETIGPEYPDLRGCGMIGANLSDSTNESCRVLASVFVSTYDGVMLPTEDPAGLTLRSFG